MAPLPSRIGPDPGGRALLFVTDLTQTRGDERVDILRGLYGLSPAEAHIALALADGESPMTIAATRRRSVETVRSQVKSLMRKLGASRQAELVGLLHGLWRAVGR